MCELKLPVTTFYIHKGKLFNNFSKILKKIFCSYWQDYNLIFVMLLKQE